MPLGFHYDPFVPPGVRLLDTVCSRVHVMPAEGYFMRELIGSLRFGKSVSIFSCTLGMHGSLHIDIADHIVCYQPSSCCVFWGSSCSPYVATHIKSLCMPRGAITYTLIADENCRSTQGLWLPPLREVLFTSGHHFLSQVS